MSAAPWLERPFDKALLDPPRNSSSRCSNSTTATATSSSPTTSPSRAAATYAILAAFAINLFACKPGRAAELRVLERLLDQPLGAGDSAQAPAPARRRS
ncbi:MAG: hypothetical protein ACLFS2_08115 [Halochromatium sp.]|uniref:hypothetical protein n=1 Tax=Halochromatium sp. TaxID=2049430 RepID=UPI00397D69ED